MADYGIKISKVGADISSSNINDYIFWSKYPSLVFMEKKTVEIKVTSLYYSGTVNVPHSYDFFPLVLGYACKTAGNPSDFNNQKYIMPTNNFAGIECNFGFFQTLSFTYTINSDSVDIVFEASCTDGIDTEGPIINATFEVYLYFFMWELGT